MGQGAGSRRGSTSSSTLVGLDPARFRDRYPSQLSGGQRQRVGVARALGADPPVLLMDEPFGAIDPINRDRLQNEFLRLQAEVRKTIVFVTHDIEEAVKLGDRIAILAEGGVLNQFDTPAEILAHPANDFVADFVGADRGLKRLKVTPHRPRRPRAAAHRRWPARPLADARRSMDADGAEYAIVIDPDRQLHGYLSRARAEGDGHGRSTGSGGWRRPCPSSATLKDAFSEMLLFDAGWVAVVDGNRFLGVLTPDSLHQATRRSISEHAAGMAPVDALEPLPAPASPS